MIRDPVGYESLQAATAGYRFDGFGVEGLKQWLALLPQLKARRDEIAALSRMAGLQDDEPTARRPSPFF